LNRSIAALSSICSGASRILSRSISDELLHALAGGFFQLTLPHHAGNCYLGNNTTRASRSKRSQNPNRLDCFSPFGIRSFATANLRSEPSYVATRLPVGLVPFEDCPLFLARTASPARTHWSFLLQRFLMNKSARWFVQKIVLAARIVASKSVGHPTHTVAELQRQIHEDLRRQHPEWIEPGGESPMCDLYEARLRRLLETCARSGPAEAA
jgi:hypothetical protein